jgi:porin
VLKANVREDFYLQAGVYEVNPTLPLQPNGFKLGTSGATGVIVPGEIGWKPTFGAAALPGHYRVGGYYDTSNASYLGSPIGGPQSTQRGRWGFYVQADQMLHRTTPGTDRGLTAFAVAAYAGPDTAMLQTYWQIGLLQKGTFTGRDHDTIGLALNQVRVSNQLIAAQNAANILTPGSVAVQSAETAIELNYRAQVTPWSTLMPNIQYVMNPNAVTSIPNALVLGLQVKLTF